MSTTTNTTQITLRHVSPQLKELVNKRAREESISINQYVLNLLERGVGFKPATKKPDWHKSIGVLPEASFNDSIFEDFERVDEKMWR